MFQYLTILVIVINLELKTILLLFIFNSSLQLFLENSHFKPDNKISIHKLKTAVLLYFSKKLINQYLINRKDKYYETYYYKKNIGKV